MWSEKKLTPLPGVKYPITILMEIIGRKMYV
jgi:hypothetical protein